MSGHKIVPASSLLGVPEPSKHETIEQNNRDVAIKHHAVCQAVQQHSRL